MKWWGYVHTNGTIQVKRYFDKQDLEEMWHQRDIEHDVDRQGMISPTPSAVR